MREKLESLSFKLRLYIHYGLCVAGSLLIMLGSQGSNPSLLHPVVIIGMLTLIAGLVFRVLYVKCPHCGDGQYQSRADLKNCCNCGKDLNDTPRTGRSIP